MSLVSSLHYNDSKERKKYVLLPPGKRKNAGFMSSKAYVHIQVL